MASRRASELADPSLCSGFITSCGSIGRFSRYAKLHRLRFVLPGSIRKVIYARGHEARRLLTAVA
jgi:hypothetical protein